MKRILLAYDGTDPARRALDAAADLAAAFGADVSVVSIVPSPLAIRPAGHRDELAHDRQLEDACLLLRSRGISPELLEPVGDPATAIERLAATGGFDAVVVGSRRLGILGRVVRGSVSEHVATHSAVTVVIVR